ncbi:hypothetical protein SprV_0301281500 [Sparganum proliferum]
MSATNKLDTDMSTRCDGCRELTTRVLKLEVDFDLLTEIIASLLKFNKIKPPEHDTKDMKNINEPDLMNLKKLVKGYRRRAQRNKRQRTKSLDKSSDSTEMDGNKDRQGNALSDNSDKANLLSDFFTSVYTEEPAFDESVYPPIAKSNSTISTVDFTTETNVKL